MCTEEDASHKTESVNRDLETNNLYAWNVHEISTTTISGRNWLAYV